MADKRISELDEITDLSNNNELLFLDSSNSNLKRIKLKDLGGNDDFDKLDYPFTILGKGSGTASQVLDSKLLAGFANNSTIKGAHIGSNVTGIANSCFYAVQFPDGLTFSEGLTSIPQGAFYNSAIGGRIEFPDSITSIGVTAFQQANISSIKFGQNLTGLGSSAFAYCSFGAATVEFPDSLLSLGAGSFYYSNIQNIKIGTGITSKASIRSAFPANGNSLKSVEISSDNTGLSSLSGIVYSKDLTSLEFVPGAINTLNVASTCTSISTQAGYRANMRSGITFPEGLSVINSNAFYYSTLPTGIVFPNSLTSIGSNAFGRTSFLLSVEIPNGSLASSAFYYSQNLTTCTLGTGVTSVGNQCFQYASALSTLNCNIPLTSIGTDAFYTDPGGGSLLTINVRTGDSTWTTGTQTLRGRSVNVIKNLP